MTNILSKEDRIQLVDSHKRALAMSQYNIQLSLIEENVKTNKDTANIAILTSQVELIDDQISALDAEKASIELE